MTDELNRRAAPADVGEDGQISDAEIAGIMGWRGPGAYTATSMRKIRRVVEQAIAADRRARENEPWLTLAHIICADAGIAPGHINDRLKVLRDTVDDLRARLAARGQEPAQVATPKAAETRMDSGFHGGAHVAECPQQATPKPAALQEKP